MTVQGWNPARIPDLDGVVAVVTGANSGIGYWTAFELARRGARVVLACRDLVRGEEALGQIRIRVPGAAVERCVLDLASLQSVREFTAFFRASHDALHLLINNAGVMAVPRRLTADGFELQLGTNHLGHFALTGLLMPELLAGASARGVPSRVVTIASVVHRSGRLDRGDLMGERSYSPWGAYGQAKLANLLFMRELHRRASKADAALLSLAAHPGYAATNLQSVGPQMSGRNVVGALLGWANRLFAQPAEQGSWPSLRAATDPEVRGGEYFGPSRMAETRGSPRRVTMSARALDDGDAAWLWQRSAELTGVEPAIYFR